MITEDNKTTPAETKSAEITQPLDSKDSLAVEPSNDLSTLEVDTDKVKPDTQGEVNGSKSENPDPPVKIKSAVDYFKSVLTSSGKTFDEKTLTAYAKRKDLKTFIRKFHLITGNASTIPTIKQADSIYNSWLDTSSIVEKKNQAVNDALGVVANPVNTNLEPQSTSTSGKPTLVSPGVISMTEEDVRNDNEEYISFQETPAELNAVTPNDPYQRSFFVQIQGNGSALDPDKFLENVVNNIPESVVNMSENDAQILLTRELRPYGFDVKQSEFGADVLNIIKPDKSSVRLRLFTDAYKARIVATGQDPSVADALAKGEFVKFKQNIYNKGGAQIIDNIATNLSVSKDLVTDIKELSASYQSLPQEDLTLLSSFIGGNKSIFYTPTMSFKPDEALKAISGIKNTLRSRYRTILENDERQENSGFSRDNTTVAQVRTDGLINRDLALPTTTPKSNDDLIVEVNEKLDDMIVHIKRRKDAASSVIGSALMVSGVWKNIDLNNLDQLKALNQAGLNIKDIPTDGIMIDGRPSTFNTLQEILTDPSSRNDIIRGKIGLKIGNPEAYGFLGTYIKAGKKLIERNEAHKIDHKGKAELVIASEWVEDVFQGFSISGLEILSNTGIVIADTLQGLSTLTEKSEISEAEAEAIVFGGFGLPAPRIPRPEEIMDLRAKYLPLWNTDIEDAESFGELLHLSNEPMATSSAYFAGFSINPAFGLSLVASSSYGGNLFDLEQRQALVRQKFNSGVPLTSQQEELYNMTKWKARGIALSTAAQETAFTRLFTFRFFKGIRGAKNFKGARTTENARLIAQEYAKRQRKSALGTYGRVFGDNFKRALYYETSEENLIAATDYGLRVLWGIEKYDYHTLSKRLKNTTYHTMFSSLTMSRFANIGRNKNLKKAVNNQIKRNITIKGEKDLHGEYLTLEGKIQSQKLSKDFDENSPEYKSLLWEQSKLGNAILFADNRKQQLVDQMSGIDKEVFLETVYRLEQQQDILLSPDKSNIVKRKAASENIPDLQRKINSILTRYPHKLGYSFLSGDKKSYFDEKAVEALEADFKEAGIENYTIDQEMIEKKAAEIYVEDVKENKSKNTEKFMPAEGYTVTDINSFLRVVTDEERGSYDLKSNIKFGKTMVTNLKTMVEGTEDTSTPEGKIASRNLAKTDEIIDRISKFNIDNDFFAKLSDQQKDRIINFFDDVRKEKTPTFGYVNAILDAHEIATEISSKSPEKIKIFDTSPTKEGSFESNLYKAINAFSQKNVSVRAGFGTGDILIKTLFRDKYVGEKFYGLFRDINRKVSVETKRVDDAYSLAAQKFKADTRNENKKNNTTKDTNILGLENSYGIALAMGFFRRSGVKENGVDVEFSRWKSLVKQELELMASDMNNSEGGSFGKYGKDYRTYKGRYDLLSRLYEEYNIEDANSYDELNIPQQIRNFVSDLAAIQPGQAALERIRDYGGSTENVERGTKQPFLDGFYVPISLRNTYVAKSSEKKSTDSETTVASASQLRELTLPETLSEDLRLNFGFSGKSAYEMTRGGAIDIAARMDATTMEYLLSNPIFEQQFDSAKDYALIKDFFKSKIDDFNTIVNQGSGTVIDLGSPNFLTSWNKFSTMAYSTISAQALTRISQRSSQFYSALAGTAPYLKSETARNYLNNSGKKFLFGISAATGGAEKNTKLGRFLRDSYLGDGDLSNLFANSRTGLRNSLNAEFALGPNTKIPADYYLKFLEVKDDDGKIINSMSAQYTINEFMDYVTRSSETSLELFLAGADRSAANTAFIAHYIDKRVEQGEDLTNINLKQWFKKENENPNTEAINYADGLIAQTMRQTEKSTEGKLYSSESAVQQTIVRASFPFQKFISNARANFANQVAIINDPTIPESQKEEARAAMRGIGREVVSFGAIKLFSNLAFLKGISVGLLGFGLDDEDIERYGGTTQFIGTYLPIEDRQSILDEILNGKQPDFADASSSVDTRQKSTKEGQFISAKLDFTNTEKGLNAFYEYSRTFDKKFKVSKDYNVFVKVMQDNFVTKGPVPFIEGTEDMFFYGMNAILQKTGLAEEDERYFSEFISKDLEKADTKQGFQAMVAENMGMLSIGFESLNKLKQAYDLYDKHEIKMSSEYGTITSYVGGGPSDEINRRLKISVATLYGIRLLTALAPVPKGDLTKIGNYLQRSIEQEFKTSQPNPKMTEFIGPQLPPRK